MSGLHHERHRGAYRWIAAVATCLALMLTAAAQRPSVVQASGESWVNCQGRPSDPGLGYIYPGKRVWATITSQAANWIDDLELNDGHGNEKLLWPDATHYGLGDPEALQDFMGDASEGKQFTLDFYVHATGKTYTSTSSNAIAAVGDGYGDRYICFEDGGDTDFDDVVVHLVWPDFVPQDLTQLKDPNLGHTPFEVDVFYNDRQLAPPGKESLNKDIARGIETRALYALVEYEALLAPSHLDGLIPHRIKIVLESHPVWYDVIGEIPNAGVECTTNEPIVKFNADTIMSQPDISIFLSNPGSGYTAVTGGWLADTIDHELWHTIQCSQLDLLPQAWRAYWEYDTSPVEGTAQAAEDLIEDTDDLGSDDDWGSFLSKAHELLEGNKTIDAYANDGQTPYRAAAFYEYLAEHYVDRPGLTQEQKVAAFLIALSDGSHYHLSQVAYAIGRSHPRDVLDKLRDFYVAAYVRSAANVTTLPAKFRIFDETTTHGHVDPWTGPTLSGQSWGNKTIIDTTPADEDYTLLADEEHDPSRTLVDNSGALWEVPVDPGTTVLDIQITNQHGAYGESLIAAVPVDASGNVVVDPVRLFKIGPAHDGETLTYTIPVSGMSKVGLIVVNGSTLGKPLKLTVKVHQINATPTLSMDPIRPVPANALRGSVAVAVRPAYDGVPTYSLPSWSFTARIDGSPADVSFSTYGDEEWGEILFLKAPNLSVGSHTIKVCLGDACATQTLEVTAGGSATKTSTHADARPMSAQASASSVDGDYGLYVTLGGTQAGLAITAQAIVVYQGLGITGAQVRATVTDPGGTVRHYVMTDDGHWLDGGTDDGEYAASLFGTNAPGTYSVVVDASGQDSDGTPFSLTATGSVTLGAMVDSDADGIADDMELALGLDPHNAADASVDLDGDGLGTAQELAIGSDPLNPDTDGGGEPDGSEVARGHDPLVATDDEAIPQVGVAAVQQDGRKFSVTVISNDGTTPLHLYRINGNTSVDLGVQPGSGVTITDGPLPAGSYSYEAVAELADGAKSLPESTVVLPAVDDATPPTADFALNGGSWTTGQRDIGITFYDTSEPLTSMRLATSREGLSSASWVPYEKYTNVTLPSTAGRHSVYAQVRDAAGLESGVLVQTIDYEPGSTPIQIDRSAFVAQGVDTDADGRYEALRFSGQVAAADECDCEVSASLVSPGNGAVSTAHQKIRLHSGANDIYVDFAGADIVASGQPGPYVVTGMGITGPGLVWTDSFFARWSTPSYQVSQFAAAPVSQVVGASRSSGRIYLSVESTEPFELWDRFKSTTGSTFGSWQSLGTYTPGQSPSVAAQGDGTYEFYSRAISSQTGDREAMPPFADISFIYDVTPPVSTMGTVPTRLATPHVTMPISASDLNGIRLLCVRDRYRASQLDSWNSWTDVYCISGSSGVADFTLPQEGFYEFISVATDNYGNREPRTKAQAFTHYTTTAEPSSHVYALETYTHLTSFPVPYEADFTSGSGTVDLYQRFKPSGGSSFTDWAKVATTVSPSQLTAPLTQGDGRYEFYTRATDSVTGVSEAARVNADTYVDLDTVAPTSSMAYNAPGPYQSPPVYLEVNSSDDTSGLAEIRIYYRYKPLGGDTFGDWKLLASTSDANASGPNSIDCPIPADGLTYCRVLDFIPVEGDGYYEISSVAIDKAGNAETGPAPARVAFLMDSAPPVVSVTPLAPATKTPSVSITFTTSDTLGVSRIELWERFVPAGGSDGEWTNVRPVSTSPAYVQLNQGDGTYSFYLLACDTVNNCMAEPSSPQASIVLDTTAPVTSAGAMPSTINNPVQSIPYTASDGSGSGLASIQLQRRFKAAGAGSFGSWSTVATVSNPGASGTIPITLGSDGTYEFRTIGVDALGNTETPPSSADAWTVLDSTAPTSSAASLTTPRTAATVTLSYTAGDGTYGTGVVSVDVYERFQAAGTTTWSSWAPVMTATASPANITLSLGDGRYEFYTRALDAAGNREAAPGSFDAFTVLDTTGPVSSVGALAAGTKTTTLSVPFTATDVGGNGVASVELYERFQAAGSTTWSSYSKVATGTTSPFSVTLGLGVGRYEFYTQAVDSLANREGVPAAADAFTVLDTTAPTSAAGPLPASITSTTLSVPYTAADDTYGSGLSKVELYQRWTAPGGTPSGAYTKLTATPSGGSFSITLGSGSGTYEFYTIATDLATNAEAAPTSADATTVLTLPDTTAPTSTITAPPSTSSAASISIPYTASDNSGGSGLASVEFWYRYRASDGATPGAWTAGGTSTAASGSFTLTFGSGAGIYDVLTVAVDKAGNRESAIANPPAAGATPKSYVRSISWTASTKVNTDTGSAVQDNAAFVVGSDGTVYAVWEDSRNGNTDIYFSSRNPTTGVWATEIKLNADTGTTGQRTPSIAIDGSGNLYVVWADDRSGSTNTDIYFVKRTGTTWSGNIKVNTDTATAVQSNPRIAVSSAGIAVAVWYDKRSSQTNIYSARLPAGSTTWSTNYNVTTSNTSAVKATPDVAVASDGTAWATWQDNRTGGGDIYVASLGPSATTWSTNTKVSDDSGASSLDKSPRIGLTSANLPVVAYLDGRTTNAQVRVVNRTSGGTWNASVQVSDSSAKPSGGLTLAVKADGGVIVAWDDTRATSAIWGAQCEAGSGTSSVTRCGPDEKWSDKSGASSHPTLVASATKVYLGWRDNTTGGGDILIRLRTPS